ncbi:hypothetical protein PAAG_11879 [Paracoccidioides lutzii Pb01]|uniref:Uncharacterized protein n=1 Tax=Paracoccidioides lutzii (strain ATCC MYA-826 / Pb01) TaxID=502779 RepID=A0A0A2V5J0_PARBA|nr:hypothetical protein PAAG_11879 [Paracoccidioides lutzii Pb01]KGQ01415.1 hypothetical protein PAAG_11879 [Paracoccidioides lutzii Pb01]
MVRLSNQLGFAIGSAKNMRPYEIERRQQSQGCNLEYNKVVDYWNARPLRSTNPNKPQYNQYHGSQNGRFHRSAIPGREGNGSSIIPTMNSRPLVAWTLDEEPVFR